MGRRTRLCAFAGVVLAAASAIIQPIALDHGEAIVYYDALRIIHGQPLYQPLDAPPYTVAAYTPLYYLAAAEIWVLAVRDSGQGGCCRW